MIPINLYDKITLEKISSGIKLTGISTDKNITWDENNLAYIAAKMFFKKTKIFGGIKIHIKKNIPAGGGLGGGSSNAVSVLEGLNLLYGNRLSINELSRYSYDIGADVPFFYTIPMQ